MCLCTSGKFIIKKKTQPVTLWSIVQGGTTEPQLQLPDHPQIFAVYAIIVLLYTGSDPNPRGGGQLPNSNMCNSTLTSETGRETLTPYPNECNSA